MKRAPPVQDDLVRQELRVRLPYLEERVTERSKSVEDLKRIVGTSKQATERAERKLADLKGLLEAQIAERGLDRLRQRTDSLMDKISRERDTQRAFGASLEDRHASLERETEAAIASAEETLRSDMRLPDKLANVTAYADRAKTLRSMYAELKLDEELREVRERFDRAKVSCSKRALDLQAAFDLVSASRQALGSLDTVEQLHERSEQDRVAQQEALRGKLEAFNARAAELGSQATRLDEAIGRAEAVRGSLRALELGLSRLRVEGGRCMHRGANGNLEAKQCSDASEQWLAVPTGTGYRLANVVDGSAAYLDAEGRLGDAPGTFRLRADSCLQEVESGNMLARGGGVTRQAWMCAPVNRRPADALVELTAAQLTAPNYSGPVTFQRDGSGTGLQVSSLRAQWGQEQDLTVEVDGSGTGTAGFNGRAVAVSGAFKATNAERVGAGLRGERVGDTAVGTGTSPSPRDPAAVFELRGRYTVDRVRVRRGPSN